MSIDILLTFNSAKKKTELQTGNKKGVKLLKEEELFLKLWWGSAELQGIPGQEEEEAGISRTIYILVKYIFLINI